MSTLPIPLAHRIKHHKEGRRWLARCTCGQLKFGSRFWQTSLRVGLAHLYNEARKA